MTGSQAQQKHSSSPRAAAQPPLLAATGAPRMSQRPPALSWPQPAVVQAEEHIQSSGHSKGPGDGSWQKVSMSAHTFPQSSPSLLTCLSLQHSQERCSEPFLTSREQDFHPARDPGVCLAPTDQTKMQCKLIKLGGHSRQTRGFSQFC